MKDPVHVCGGRGRRHEYRIRSVPQSVWTRRRREGYAKGNAKVSGDRLYVGERSGG